MAGRKTRNNCPFCQHPERDVLERQVRTGLVDNEDLDKDQGWASGTVHRHMRRHSGEYYNNSNQDCSICTHPERSEIEAAIIDGLVCSYSFQYEPKNLLCFSKQKVSSPNLLVLKLQV